MKKQYLYLGIGAAFIVVLATVLFTMNGEKPGSELTFSPEPTPDVSPTPSPTETPKPKPSGSLKVDENSHDYFALQFDEDGNRRLVLNDDCSELVPSQVTYKNNVKIMLDNSYSKNPHTLKIGAKEYYLMAGEWRFETLSSETLPAKLPIFCGTMELGQIDLI